MWHYISIIIWSSKWKDDLHHYYLFISKFFIVILRAMNFMPTFKHKKKHLSFFFKRKKLGIFSIQCRIKIYTKKLHGKLNILIKSLLTDQTTPLNKTLLDPDLSLRPLHHKSKENNLNNLTKTYWSSPYCYHNWKNKTT